MTNTTDTKFYPLKSQVRPTRKVFIYKIQVNLIHTIIKYSIFMTSWIVNGAILRGSSPWQSK